MKYAERYMELKRPNWDDLIPVVKPGRWTASNNYVFYLIQAQHTKFDDTHKPNLTNFYFNEREIEIIEEFEKMAMKKHMGQKEAGINNGKLIECLSLESNCNIERNITEMYDILRVVQQVTGNRYTVRQLNNKHINMRSRIATPLISLHESGYFYKNPFKLPAKLTVKELVKLSMDNTKFELCSNLDSKFFNVIKTLYKFSTHRHLFWDSKAEACFDYSNIEKMSTVEYDFTESDRWVHAMVAVHGQKMVGFMERCTLNFLNTYITNNLDSPKLEAAAPSFTSIHKIENRLKVFDMIVEELVDIGMQRPLEIDCNIGSNVDLPNKKKRKLDSSSVSETAYDEVKADLLGLASKQSSVSTTGAKQVAKNPLSDILFDASRPAQLVPMPDIQGALRSNSAIDMSALIDSATNTAPISNASTLVFDLLSASSGVASPGYSDFLSAISMPTAIMDSAFLSSNTMQPVNQLTLQLPQTTCNVLNIGSATGSWNNSPSSFVQPDYDNNAWLNSLFVDQNNHYLANNSGGL